MRVEFEAELVIGERREFTSGGPGPSAAGVEADDLPFEDSVQGPVLPIARKLPEGAGINSFDEEPPSPSVAKEQAARPSAGTLERLGPKVLPGLFAEISIHFLNYSKIEISEETGSFFPCPDHKAVAFLEEKQGVQSRQDPKDRIEKRVQGEGFFLGFELLG